jgi:hypothetical protein
VESRRETTDAVDRLALGHHPEGQGPLLIERGRIF